MLPLEVISAFVLGTGGASKAVCSALDDLGISYTQVSRTPSEGQLGYEELTPEVMAANRLIVNTTPLGMSPNPGACPPIPYDLLTPEHIC